MLLKRRNVRAFKLIGGSAVQQAKGVQYAKKIFKKENILTIPNLLSLIRILLIPFIIWLYCAQKAYLHTIIVIALSGFTDIIDGKIARKFNMVSDVGKVLDPVADKLTQATLVICLTARYPWMWALLALFAVKECLMLLWGYLTLKITDTIHSAKWYGKLSTVVLYAVMMILILFVDIPEAGAEALMLLCGGIILLSLVMYGRFYHAILDRLHLEASNKRLYALHEMSFWA